MERTFWTDGEVLRTEPHAGPGAARAVESVVDGGRLVPGLVDAHTHPGAEEPEDGFDGAAPRRHLEAHRDAGVLLVRMPGTMERMPGWVDAAPELPRGPVGRAVAGDAGTVPPRGALPDGGGLAERGPRRSRQPRTRQASRPRPAEPEGPPGHGVRSHLSAFAGSAEVWRRRERSPKRSAWLEGWTGMVANVRAAHEAGVTVLAGTDTFPCGTVAAEIRQLLDAALPAGEAVGAPSWAARSWLGLPGLTAGAPADLVAYDQDPVAHPEVLEHPVRIVLRGRVVR
ncbi:amidohydrolase family protein [Streptomyces koyangensis]